VAPSILSFMKIRRIRIYIYQRGTAHGHDDTVSVFVFSIRKVYWTQNNCEFHRPSEVDMWEAGGDRKTVAQREREHNHFLVLYDVKQLVQAAEVSQRRTAVSSKCFQLYYTCSDRLLAIALPPYSFHFSPLTVTFPQLSVILRPL
jgi:hypothetical protein